MKDYIDELIGTLVIIFIVSLTIAGLIMIWPVVLAGILIYGLVWLVPKLGEFGKILASMSVVAVILGVAILIGYNEPVFETRSFASVSDTVYRTRTGSCYHRANCGYLKSSIELSEAEAIEQGLRACSRCNP